MQKVQRCVRFLNVVETRSQSHTTRLSCYYDATKKRKEKEKLTTFSTMQRHIWVAWGRSMFLISSRSCLDSSGDGKRKEGKKNNVQFQMIALFCLCWNGPAGCCLASWRPHLSIAADRLRCLCVCLLTNCLTLIQSSARKSQAPRGWYSLLVLYGDVLAVRDQLASVVHRPAFPTRRGNCNSTSV